MQQYDAFVSYSRRDEALVKPVVKLLSVSNRRIFWDAQIAPGARWMDSIADALAASNTIIVIWCCHAAESRYVQAEVLAALGDEKPVVPVLICPYPLREPLDEIQGVDFRGVTRHSCIDGHPTDDGSGPVAPHAFEDPEAVSAVDMWRAVINPRSAVRPMAMAIAILFTLFTLPFIAPITILAWFIAGIGAWATGIFRGAPMDRTSLQLAAVIETAIRRAERARTTAR